MTKREYTTYTGGIRYYDVEKEWQEAAVDAERLDAAIADGRPAHEIMRILYAAADRLDAVLARSIRLGRIFYADFLSGAGPDARRFLQMNSHAMPKVYQRLLKGREAPMPIDELRRILEMLSASTPDNLATVREIYANEKWLAGRMLHDDIYCACCDEAKEFLLDVAMNADPVLRRSFVAQVMTCGRADRMDKVRAYRKLRPYREYTTTARKEDIKTSAYVLGHHVFVNAAHNGLTQPYSSNLAMPDYQLAVCSKVQEAYAESGYVRYQWSRNKLPGYETVRCSFPQFASMSDNYSNSVDRMTMEKVCWDDNPGNLVLACDMQGVRFGLKQIVYLMRNARCGILKFILGEAPDLLRTVNLTQMLFYVSAYGNWKIASEAAAAIESSAPGTVASAFDHFGNTPIWYTLYELDTTNRYSDLRVIGGSEATGDAARKDYVKLLESFGCNRYHKNHLGVSYADVERK